MNHKILSGIQICSILKNANHLGVNRLEYSHDRSRNLLIILAESDLMLCREVYVSIRENSLVIEAPVTEDLDRPFRTHLLNRENLDEIKGGGIDIEFSEIKLNKKFSYDILSYNLVKPGLLKIVLSCKPAENLKN